MYVYFSTTQIFCVFFYLYCVVMLTRLSQFIDHLNISVRQFETSVNVTEGIISKAIRNKTGFNTKWLVNIAEKYPQLNTNWLLTGVGNMICDNSPIQLADIEEANKFSLRSDNDIEMQRIPLYDIEATAGIVSLFTDTFSQEPESYLSIPDVPPCDGAIRVVGNSMDPIIRGGDIVLFKKIHNMDWGVAWGEMHIISFGIDGDEYIMVKYLKKGRNDKTVILASENPAYDPMEIPIASIRALAIVKASVRYNTMR